MPAYLIGRMNVVDAEAYENYKKEVPAIIKKYGGRFMTRGGKTVSLEGKSDPRRVVLIEFPSLQHAQDFYSSPEYVSARALRAGATMGMELIAIEGFEA